jgi:hypothetical protein
MRVDLQDRQIVGVPTSELGERRHAHGALAAEGRDPRRVVLADDLQGGCELFENDGLGFDTVACLKAASDILTGAVAVGAVVRRQDGIEDCRASGGAAAGDVEREFGSELSDAGCAAALPLGQMSRRLTPSRSEPPVGDELGWVIDGSLAECRRLGWLSRMRVGLGHVRWESLVRRRRSSW